MRDSQEVAGNTYENAAYSICEQSNASRHGWRFAQINAEHAKRQQQLARENLRLVDRAEELAEAKDTSRRQLSINALPCNNRSSEPLLLCMCGKPENYPCCVSRHSGLFCASSRQLVDKHTRRLNLHHQTQLLL